MVGFAFASPTLLYQILKLIWRKNEISNKRNMDGRSKTTADYLHSQASGRFGAGKWCAGRACSCERNAHYGIGIYQRQ